jgi:hypothetical protein
MDVWIVAIDHGLQLARDTNDSAKTQALKQQLEDLLMSGVPERAVRFIAEESKVNEITIASLLADASDPKIPWINIFMTDAERAAVGITEAYKKRPGHPDEDTMQTWIEYRVPQDEIREDFFVERTLQEFGGAQSILMLLGDLHVDAVGEKLTELGHNVTVNHELFPVRRWRNADAF